MRCVLLLTGLLALLPAATSIPEAAAEDGIVNRAHVRVHGRGVAPGWTELAADLGEALYERLKQDLGREPPVSERPLVLTLHATREGFEAAVRTSVRPEAPERVRGWTRSWTSWSPGGSHVQLQAEDFDTRRLVLHELVHQFYAKSRPAHLRGKGADWYREGLAAWYGWHRRTPAGIQFGQFGLAVRNDTVRDIHTRLFRKRDIRRRAPVSLLSTAHGAVRAQDDTSLALVAGLRASKEPSVRDSWAAFQANALARGDGVRAFRALFRDHEDALERAVRTFWLRQPIPWSVSGHGWDERSDRLVLAPPAFHLAKGGPDTLGGTWLDMSATLEFPGGSKGRGGFVFSRAGGNGPWDLAVEVRPGTLEIIRLRGTNRVAVRGPRGAGGVEEDPVLTRELPAARRYVVRVDAKAWGLEVSVRAGKTRVQATWRIPAWALRDGRKPSVHAVRSWLERPQLIAREGPVHILRLVQDDTILFPRTARTR